MNILKTLFAIITILCVPLVSIAAEEPKVEITSFRMAGSRTYAAEICGKVTGPSNSAVVRLIIDEKGKTPGVYHAIVEADGAFCTAVVTYYGTASATVRSGSTTISSAVSEALKYDRDSLGRE